ncbi:CDP-6-deoxy-delta-3,4-glucoseen reductase [Thiohalobacter sp. COW1]|uniref:RecA/RadA recombinase n=1 Tax=Thiohalobacter thiocyanaticus TaxID=585455 RepID=A0A1Z4VUK8_9GAMM|nr:MULTISPECIES: SulA-like leucine-rich domain-containing protein [Thiohalobacter]BAZ95102.1 recA/RadA recombinase [Thiohalobacter thiocyanaticus]BCO32969.1 CDP-6-deoxy-delta-3,4-glucoseen reductase [Thiohalobacter sp. COW1]
MESTLHQLNPAPAGDAGRVVTTGIPALDACLPAGGWPRVGLIELRVEDAGAAMLPLLLPHMAQLSQASRWQAWLSPPFAPYLPALERAGVAADHLLLIRPRSHQNGLEVLERALALGNFVSVFAWPLAQETDLMQRLRAAAQRGQCQAFLFSTLADEKVAADVDLCLRVRSHPEGLSIERLSPHAGRAQPASVLLRQ